MRKLVKNGPPKQRVTLGIRATEERKKYLRDIAFRQDTTVQDIGDHAIDIYAVLITERIMVGCPHCSKDVSLTAERSNLIPVPDSEQRLTRDRPALRMIPQQFVKTVDTLLSVLGADGDKRNYAERMLEIFDEHQTRRGGR